MTMLKSWFIHHLLICFFVFSQINFKAFQSSLLLHEITNETNMHLVTY